MSIRCESSERRMLLSNRMSKFQKRIPFISRPFLYSALFFWWLQPKKPTSTIKAQPAQPTFFVVVAYPALFCLIYFALSHWPRALISLLQPANHFSTLLGGIYLSPQAMQESADVRNDYDSLTIARPLKNSFQTMTQDV